MPRLSIFIAFALAGVAIAETPRMSTTLADQQDVAITAYNNGVALVRDTRAIQLPAGESSLQFEDVAQQIRPETVGLRSTSAPGSVTILEQNYEYDLISPAKLMEKYVGKQVKLVNFKNDINLGATVAELLSMNEGEVYRVGNEIYLGFPGQVVLPKIPENLIAKPSLIWQLANESAGQTLEVTYLTNGVSWTADYVVTVDKTDTTLDVAGWVTMNNQSGATYNNAQLKLVAGQVNIVTPIDQDGEAPADNQYFFEARKALPQQEAFAEYHLYTMPRRTTIKQNQSKQLALLSGENVKCAKKFEYRGQLHFYSQQVPATGEEHVGVFLEFRNEEANGLGIPLPGGVMRVYKEDSDGMLQFAGEDRIEHTPKDEDITLRLGDAFDVVAERVQTDYQVFASNAHESAFEITIRNHKDTDITVDVVEPIGGDWTIREESIKHVKKDAQTAVFTVPVPKDGEAKLTYRAYVRY